jgi:acetyl esterase
MTGPRRREPPHPEVEPLHRRLLALAGVGREPGVGGVRDALAALSGLFPRASDAARQEAIWLPTRAGSLRALLFRPRREPASGLLVYLHGGGWVGLSPESHAALCTELCARASIVVASPDYRLAPEHPYPAPGEDCVAAFRHLRAQAEALGADPDRVALAGDSTGANLAAAVTLHLLANGEPPPRTLALLCPVLDVAFEAGALHAPTEDAAALDAGVLRLCRDSYVGREQWSDPFVSPLRAELSGFPPTCVVVGGIDPLRDDGRRFADRLRAAGGEVELHDHAGMPHDFFLFQGLDDAGHCVSEVARFLRTWLA